MVEMFVTPLMCKTGLSDGVIRPWSQPGKGLKQLLLAIYRRDNSVV